MKNKIPPMDLAIQLNCPSGTLGVSVAHRMNEANGNMIQETIESLNLIEKECVLEIGHGNASHVVDLLERQPKISYYGLEISELMNLEALRINQKSIDKGQAVFQVYDGNSIPSWNVKFDKIFSVNTIYFFKKPIDLCNQISRVLQPQGIFSLAFVQKKTMVNLPFSKYGFQLYGLKEIEAMVSKSNLQIIEVLERKERVKSNIGDWVDRAFFIIKMAAVQ